MAGDKWFFCSFNMILCEGTTRNPIHRIIRMTMSLHGIDYVAQQIISILKSNAIKLSSVCELLPFHSYNSNIAKIFDYLIIMNGRRKRLPNSNHAHSSSNFLSILGSKFSLSLLFITFFYSLLFLSLLKNSKWFVWMLILQTFTYK